MRTRPSGSMLQAPTGRVANLQAGENGVGPIHTACRPEAHVTPACHGRGFLAGGPKNSSWTSASRSPLSSRRRRGAASPASAGRGAETAGVGGRGAMEAAPPSVAGPGRRSGAPLCLGRRVSGGTRSRNLWPRPQAASAEQRGRHGAAWLGR